MFQTTSRMEARTLYAASSSNAHPHKGPILGSLFALLLLSGIAPPAHAQALPAATRNSGVDVFVTGGHGDTDYGATGAALSVGGDVALFGRPRLGLQTAVEARLIVMPSDNIGTKDFAGGIRVGKTLHFHRITPYADFLIGYGTISFPGLHNPGYSHDNSITYNFGGGVDIPVIGPFSAKVDYQEESWKLGSANSRLTPSAFTVGAVYTLPLSFHIHR